MSADVLDLLRAADPAANMPETTTDEREQLRRAMVATPLDPRRRLPRRHGRPRVILVASIAGGLILMGGGGVYAATVLLEPLPKGPQPPINVGQWRNEFNAWKHKIPLPPGAHWRGIRIPANTGSYRGAGAQDAVYQAMGWWIFEWIAANKAGDAPRATVAEGWVTRLWALVLVNTSGDQSIPGTDIDSKAYGDAAFAEAKAGHFGMLRRWARQEIPGLIKVEPYPTPTHFLGWMGEGDGATADITLDQARAEYRAVLRVVGVPPGVDLDARRKLLGGSGVFRDHYCLGDGFMQAFDDVWTAWWREWVAAAKAGDRERIAAAAAATARLQGLVPRTLSSQSGREETWSLEPEPQRDLERLAARARKGDMRGIEEWGAFQDAYARIMREIAGYED